MTVVLTSTTVVGPGGWYRTELPACFWQRAQVRWVYCCYSVYNIATGVNSKWFTELRSQQQVVYRAQESTASGLQGSGVNSKWFTELRSQQQVVYRAQESTASGLQSSGVNSKWFTELRSQQQVVYRAQESTASGLQGSGVNSKWFTELRSYVKVEVAVLGSPPLISLMVSVDVK